MLPKKILFYCSIILFSSYFNSSYGQADLKKQVTEETLKVVNRLGNTRVILDFSDAPLPQIISFLTDISGINFKMDPSLKETGNEIKVNLKVQNTYLEDVLIVLCHHCDLSYFIEKKSIVLTEDEVENKLSIQ